MRLVKLYAAIIIALLTASPALMIYAEPQSQGNTDTKTRTEKAFERLCWLASRAMDKANESIMMGMRAGLNQSIINKAISYYNNGTELLKLANFTFESNSGNYTGAIKLVLMAMRNFRMAIVTVTRHWKETGLETGWMGLSGAIDRAEEFLERVRTLINRTREMYPDYNYTDIEQKLNEAIIHLEYAKGNLTALNFRVAAREIGELRYILAQITAELRKIGHSTMIKSRRITSFIDHSMKRLIDRIHMMARKKGVNITEHISWIKTIIDEAKDLAKKGELRSAMMKIRIAHKFIGEMMREFHMSHMWKWRWRGHKP